MPGCIFCEIVQENLPAAKVYEDQTVLAILDINPVTTGHLLVIPRRHFAGLSDMDEATGVHMFRVAQRLQNAIRASGVRCEGINLFLADGEAAFQEVFHVHLHVFPRYRGDTFTINADWSHPPPREELNKVAAKIRSAYNKLRLPAVD